MIKNPEQLVVVPDFRVLKIDLLLEVRVVACIQTFNDFVGDVVCRVRIKQVVETCVADDQIITLSFVVNLEE